MRWPIGEIPQDDLGGVGVGSRGEKGEVWQRVYLIQESLKKVLSSISRMSQIDPKGSKQ